MYRLRHRICKFVLPSAMSYIRPDLLSKVGRMERQSPDWLCFYQGVVANGAGFAIFTCHKRAYVKFPILTLALFFQICIKFRTYSFVE